MMKDRDQKQKALTLSVANRWFPQVEVDVQTEKSLGSTRVLVTDLDVFSSLPDEFKGYRTVVFDCKTKNKESPVNRALWLKGVLDRMHSDQGFCILKKDTIHLDHRLMATQLGVILLAEDEFDLYAGATSQRYKNPSGISAQLDVWDKFFAIPERFPKFREAMMFLRSKYWMIGDAAEACRKTVASLRNLHSEMDPAKPEHLAVFFDYCALFSRSLAVLVCHIFRAYLHPEKQGDLAEALLTGLYGGREAYEFRNELFRFVKSSISSPVITDLSLPEWDRFLQLTRQLLDAPMEAQKAPLILREVGFATLCGDTELNFARILCSETPQGARFALLVSSYLSKAANLPPEFTQFSDKALFSILPIK